MIYVAIAVLIVLLIYIGLRTACNQFQFTIIIRPKIPFYVLQWTWGILMNIAGLVGLVIGLCFKKKPERFGRDILIPTTGYWGLSLGMFVFANPIYKDMLCHEHGHSFQNAVFGPFMILLVGIPSVIRFWYREAVYKWGNYRKLPDYDAIWFEGMATKSGITFMEEYKNAK